MMQAGSAGSNKGPANEEYLAEVEARIDTFLLHHPYLQRKEVPAEMVTASASGLDPDITPVSAYVQVKRVAEAREWLRLLSGASLTRLLKTVAGIVRYGESECAETEYCIGKSKWKIRK